MLAVTFILSSCSNQPTIKEHEEYALNVGAKIFDKKSDAYKYVESMRKDDKVTMAKMEEESTYQEVDILGFGIYVYSCDEDICNGQLKPNEFGEYTEEEIEEFENTDIYIQKEYIIIPEK